MIINIAVFKLKTQNLSWSFTPSFPSKVKERRTKRKQGMNEGQSGKNGEKRKYKVRVGSNFGKLKSG